MAYFSAVVAAPAGGGARWSAVEVDVDDAADVDDLAETARSASEDAGTGDGPVLVVLEREDEWFALLRADGREPRLFVSDAPAVEASRYAELLASAADAPAPVPPRPGGDDEDAESGTAPVAAPTWAGDAGLLEDLGVGADDLAATAEGRDPASALVELGERCGFADLLEALR